MNVSPAMYEEFVFPYEKPIMDRFGLTCYGCCEPLHGRWHVIKRHHGLRRVSVSPWADVEKMADYLQDRYIFSLKPNPAVARHAAHRPRRHPRAACGRPSRRPAAAWSR